MSERGMKKWAPYASLIEQKNTIQAMRQQRNKQTKPRLSQEAAEALNFAIQHCVGKTIKVRFFYQHTIYVETFLVIKRDEDNKRLVCEEFSIPYKDLLEIDILSQILNVE
jgi:hypothetical protein